MKKLSLLPAVFILLFISNNLFGKERYRKEDNVIRIMSYNIRNAKGLDDITDYKRIANVIQSLNPDIVALQELDSVTGRSKGINVISELATRTCMYPVFGSAIAFDGGKYGVGLLSKKRPLSVKHQALPGKEEKRTLLIAEFDNYIVCCTHLSLTEEDRKTSVSMINTEIQNYDKPVFLAGDLNTEPDSDDIKILAENWKILSDSNQKTFPADNPESTLDYILGYAKNKEIYSVFQAKTVKEPLASDHRPIFVDVRIKTPINKIMRTIPYLQNPSETAMTIMWLTNVPCRSWVEYGTDSTDMQRVRTFIEGEMVAGNTINKIKLNNLKPGTKYYYRTVSQEITLYRAYRKEFGDTVRSKISSFTTWDPQKQDFTVIILNDLHKNLELFDSLCNQVKNIKYNLVIFNGDCLDDVETERDIVEAVDYYSKRLKGNEIPSIYMRGNHETRGAYSIRLWDYLDRKGQHSYGAFTFGNARFVFLDNGEDKPDSDPVYFDMNNFEQHRINQKLFLEKEVKSKDFKDADKRILIHHIPIYGKNQDNYNPCKALWEPILKNAGFTFSINAHTHEFEYLEENQDNNTYPVVIGGGNNINTGTISILQKQGKKINIRVLNSNGTEKLNKNF